MGKAKSKEKTEETEKKKYDKEYNLYINILFPYCSIILPFLLHTENKKELLYSVLSNGDVVLVAFSIILIALFRLIDLQGSISKNVNVLRTIVLSLVLIFLELLFYSNLKKGVEYSTASLWVYNIGYNAVSIIISITSNNLVINYLTKKGENSNE